MADSPYEKRLAARAKGHHGRVSEKKLAKTLGGRQTPASGAMEGAKGDVKVKDYLVEAKSTINASMKVDYEWLTKITQEALAIGRIPALSVSFVTENGVAKKNGQWVAIPEWLFKELLGDTHG